MTARDCMRCPDCQATNVRLLSSVAILSDVRMDTLLCPTCGTQWRSYSQVQECNIEITFRPAEATSVEQAPVADPQEADSTEDNSQ